MTCRAKGRERTKESEGDYGIEVEVVNEHVAGNIKEQHTYLYTIARHLLF